MTKLAMRALIALVLALQASGAANNDRSYFAARRNALMKKIEGSIAVFEGAADTFAYTPFRQDNNFYYLTGVEVPQAYLIIDAVEHRSILFLPPRNRLLELWEGPRLYPGEEARVSTGLDDVLDDSQFQSQLEKRKGSGSAIYTPMKPEETAGVSRDRALQFNRMQEKSPWDGRVSRTQAFDQNLKKKLGESVNLKDLSPILDEMRRVKDQQEIERMREAARIGALGLTEAISATKAGLYEHQIATVAEFFFKWNGASGPAYFPVVGSGPNSCILHYHVNSRKMESGDLVVMDFGPDFRYYASDITRTFPVSGKFTGEQARVYQVVLEAQKAAISRIRPGATFDEISTAAHEVIKRSGEGQYWRHGVSHYVGMSTHDVGEIRPLQAGVVLTVEPGVYIDDKQIGVRIEDTVLVTGDGCEVLSKGVPKEIPEIEHLMTVPNRMVPR